MMKIATYLCFILCFCITGAAAQTTPDPNRNEPLEITADDSLEWHRNDLYFKAKKNVRAVQGDTILFSDILIAKYSDSKNNGMNIHTIHANGHVKIISPQGKAYGDKAIYSIDKDYAVMVGKNLRLISKDQTVTARDKFKYWVSKGRLEAIGKAKATRLGDTLESDKIIAIFKKDKDGKSTLKTLEAIGNVVITTPDEVLTGGRATYQASTNIAELHDNVKIIRGPNILEGTRAQVNLNTNISKIFGGIVNNGGNSGRVRGIFYPDSQEKPDSE